jgi:hypothetical protein
MKKLRLSLDTLTVESFAPRAEAPRPGGTVHGHADPPSAEQTACADVCASQVATCATCDAYCDEDAWNRRIILY